MDMGEKEKPKAIIWQSKSSLGRITVSPGPAEVRNYEDKKGKA